MKKIKKVQPGGFYIFESRSSANSCYFQNKKEAIIFYNLFDNHLRNFVKVYEYVLLDDGWVIALKVKKWDDFASYLNEGENETWRIISERIRRCISQYVPAVNKIRGRSGGLVHSCYERYLFDTKKEALGFLKRIRNREIDPRQQNGRYRAKRKRSKRLRKLEKGSLILSSKRGRRVKDKGRIPLKSYVWREFQEVVVAMLVQNTKIIHTPQIPPD